VLATVEGSECLQYRPVLERNPPDRGGYALSVRRCASGRDIASAWRGLTLDFADHIVIVLLPPAEFRQQAHMTL